MISLLLENKLRGVRNEYPTITLLTNSNLRKVKLPSIYFSKAGWLEEFKNSYPEKTMNSPNFIHN